MALSTRTRIAIAVAGVAGAAVVGTGGAVALADPGGGRVELQIVGGHRDAPPPGAQNGAPAGAQAGWTAHDPGKDCPEGAASPEPAQAADGR